MGKIEEFFEPLGRIKGITDSDYSALRAYLESLQAISRMIDISYYIIDYSKQGFLYVSEHPLFLAGYDKEEVLNLGYEFYARVVPEEDLQMLLEINEKGFGFYFNLPVERRPKGFISYDFRIRFRNGELVLINHKLTPLILNEEGNLWISLCLVTLSTAQKPGNMFIQMQDEGVKYDYSFVTKRFKKGERVLLTKMEKKVLQYLSLGYESNEIANLLCVSINTIKFHKRNIFSKLNAKNSNEAVYLSSIQTPYQKNENI